MDDVRRARVGVIGLGQMGLGMAKNLVKGGFDVTGFDPRAEARAAFAAAGGAIAADNRTLVAQCDVVLTSLTSPVYLKIVEELLVPAARAGQVFVDASTIAAPRARAVFAALAARNAHALDAPVTGGVAAAERGTLRMFVGGERAVYDRCLPLLQAMCKPDGVSYGGGAGQGQVMKVVQQLKNRITDAVRLEVIAFGLRAGLTVEQVRRALDVGADDGDPYAKLLSAIASGRGEAIDVVFAEWGYYLEEAREKRIPMPALESLYEFCREGERVCRDGVGRMAPSVWHELSTKSGPALGEGDVRR